MPGSKAVPALGQKPALRDIGWLAHYSLRGSWQLIKARIAFRNFAASDLVRRNKAARTVTLEGIGTDPVHLARIAYVLPRLSHRLPWRSDCLIQSMAAQDWLAASGLESEIQIGVEKPENGAFAAHAWLIHRGAVVTGGDVSKYAVLFAQDPGP
ncbi:lasso peptide biosynthesis B2 protein [Erythrobacter insulae]|nr:lasso peptide biosynthesis B2 protein [Erythrobacter insulae]